MARWVFQGEDADYLSGRSFSNGRFFQGIRTPTSSRFGLLVDQSRNKTVLHVGFADHGPLIEEKRRNGQWLHDRISQVAKRAVGVDIDASLVSRLSDDGVADIYSLDVTTEITETAVNDVDFDVIILGEVLEHIGNPVHFLERLRTNLGRPGQLVLVTVPNAWNLRSLVDAINTRECVNTDHRYWFTPYTLARVLTDAGLSIEHIDTCSGSESPAATLKGKAYKAIVGRYGLLQDNIVAFARVPD